MSEHVCIQIFQECTGEHSHPYPQILVPLQETMRIRAEETEYEVKLQELFFVPPGMNHRCNYRGRLLVLSAVFGTLKAVALLCTFNYAGVLLAQPLQLLGYGLFTPASVYFVNESVPEADRVRGQTVMMVASNGMGGMLGGLLAGWTLDMGGVNWMLAACIACGCAGAALCWAALRCPARRTV